MSDSRAQTVAVPVVAMRWSQVWVIAAAIVLGALLISLPLWLQR
jgi:hypothetical protein